jgi:transcriptional regulator with XRE-family HTH domain
MNIVKHKAQGRRPRAESGVDLEAIGDRIRQLRGESTQEEFARTMKVSQAQLSKYELGQSAPALGFLVRLSARFGKSVDWILIGKG